MTGNHKNRDDVNAERELKDDFKESYKNIGMVIDITPASGGCEQAVGNLVKMKIAYYINQGYSLNQIESVINNYIETSEAKNMYEGIKQSLINTCLKENIALRRVAHVNNISLSKGDKNDK